MMMQLSQNKGSSNSGIGNGKAAVNMESTMLASGIQQSVRNLVSVVEKPISNSINANNADDISLQQIVLRCTHEQQRDNETMEALILCCKEFSTPEFLYIFYIYDVYIFFCCCYVYVFLKLIKELTCRFCIMVTNEAIDDEKKSEDFKEIMMKPIQLNVVKNLRTWMKLCWEEDLANDKKVIQVLEVWMKQMQMDSNQYSGMDCLLIQCKINTNATKNTEASLVSKRRTNSQTKEKARIF
ncbi:hypothetical protein RFI_26304 [Reticulomyxa filosa]|uniref:Uncharacterized protein n=1 Tax=Reticulomyxa filosa TaxID=46433 RepID=X6MCA4_RETFI|nr:hypothetical protein RFI_26304 [Reticulomyxa filosa]|eukprot:ETO11072.1 hypothetical protein RFI_26304 [Reticulomyxa filosa]